MIFVYKDDKLRERASLLEALSMNKLAKGVSYRKKIIKYVPDKRASVVSVIGAGGKTTLLHHLEEEYVKMRRQAVVLTTTRIMHEDKPYFLEDASIQDIRRALDRFGRVWIGSSDPVSGKTAPPSKEILEQVLRWKLPILIEADGAKRMPVKVPAEHEPVILGTTDHVLSVYGLDAVGQTLASTCFRAERAGKILQKSVTERITVNDIATLASSDKAGRKGSPAFSQYTVVLNKADDSLRQQTALEICRELSLRGVEKIVVTSFAREKE